MQNGTHVVLLVDDDHEPLELLEHFFQINNYIVLKSSSVLDAIQKLNETIDLVVTDYDMPIMNGADLRLILKKSYPNLPVIGISGLRFMDRGTVAKLFDAFLTKPFRISDLRAKVAQLVLYRHEGVSGVVLEAI